MLKTRLAVWRHLALALASLAATATLGAGCGTEPVPDAPSFAVDVAPIMHARCVRCHGAGGTLNDDPAYVVNGPHTTPVRTWLDAYDDRGDCVVRDGGATGPDCRLGAKSNAATILAYVDTLKAMPPPPAPKLTDRQLEVIKRWVAGGAQP